MNIATEEKRKGSLDTVIDDHCMALHFNFYPPTLTYFILKTESNSDFDINCGQPDKPASLISMLLLLTQAQQLCRSPRLDFDIPVEFH